MIKRRTVLQIFFFTLSVVLFYGIVKRILADVHAYCPYSIICFGFKSFSWYIYPVVMISGIGILISSVFLGRWFCSFVCYFGILQEWLYGLFHIKSKKHFNFTNKIDNWLKQLKFLVLFMTAVMAIFGIYNYMKYCPNNIIASFNNFFEQIGDIGIISFIFLFLIIVLSILIERFWCRYLCPYGALMVILIKISDKLKIKRSKLYRNLETCIDCYKCNYNCPMQINLLNEEFVNDAECLQCNRCQEVCPKKGTLTKNWR